MKKTVRICIDRYDGTGQEIVLYEGDRFDVKLSYEPSHEKKPVSPVFKVGDNVRYKGTANTCLQKDNMLRVGDVYEIAGIGLHNDGTILLKGKTSWYGTVHFELVGLPKSISKFKVGDSIRLIQHGMLNGECAEWTRKDNLEIGSLYTVRRTENTCIRVSEDGYWCESVHFELVSAPMFKKGDVIRLLQHGQIGNESTKWTELGKLEIGNLYTVKNINPISRNEMNGWVQLNEGQKSTLHYYYHPAHFELVPTPAFKKGDIVRFVQGGALDWEGTDWAKDDELEVGCLYTIARISNGRGDVQVKEGKYNMVLSQLHFKYVATLADKEDC